MSRTLLLLLVAGLALAEHHRYRMDWDWLFYRGDSSDYATTSYDASAWTTVSIPHDFVVEGAFTSAGTSSFGYLLTGVGWYRKTFTAPETLTGRQAWLTFDGVQTTAHVYVNGVFVGKHNTGYTSFNFSVPDGLLNVGESNVLAVRVNSTPDSWWYDGGGIYRHVWLDVTEKLRVSPWSVYANPTVTGPIYKDDDVLTASASVAVETAFHNDNAVAKNVVLKSTILDRYGDVVSSASDAVVVAASAPYQALQQTIPIATATLWSMENPYLYTLLTELYEVADNGDSTLIDTVRTKFGVRTLAFNVTTGFYLNGEWKKLQGVCNHQDFAGLGVAVPDSFQYWRVKKMKEWGVNAWRCSHNSVNAELLDACDELGVVVMDENHRNNIDAEAQADLVNMVHRDRNHPSIIFWSLCNENNLCASFKAANSKVLNALVKTMDKTRAVTAAMNKNWFNTGMPATLDVTGINYNPVVYDIFRKQFPTYPVVSTEFGSTVTDRGEYLTLQSQYRMSSFDLNGTNTPSQTTTAQRGWGYISDRTAVEGGFLWTGFDYKGETTPYSWPNVNSHFGFLDIAGFEKDQAFLYAALWKTEPVLHIFPHWDPIVYTTAPYTPVYAMTYNPADPYQSVTFTGSDGKYGQFQVQTDDGLMCITSQCMNSSLLTCNPAIWAPCDAQDSFQLFKQNISQMTYATANNKCLVLTGGTGAEVGIAACSTSYQQKWLYNASTNTFHNQWLYSLNQVLTYGIGKYRTVWAYSNADSVELFVNGESQGAMTMPRGGHLQWSVEYAPGTLRALAFDSCSNVIAEDTVTTTSDAVRIVLTNDLYDRTDLVADGYDIAPVKAALVDAQGLLSHAASHEVTFTISGVGRIVGTGNGDPSSHVPDHSPVRPAFHGLVRALVGASKVAGTLVLTASAPGLIPATIEITVGEAPKDEADPCLLQAGKCLIDGVCYSEGDTKGCMVCNPALTTLAWSYSTDSCDDRNPCTTDDVCTQGVCVGTYACDDGDDTTDDQCTATGCTHTPYCLESAGTCWVDRVCYQSGAQSPANGCMVCDPAQDREAFSYSTATCDDGLACTSGDVCSHGVCAGTYACDDHSPATVDTCHEPTGCVHTPLCAYSFSAPEIPSYSIAVGGSDRTLNTGNPLRLSSGGAIQYGCNGQDASYLWDDGVTWNTTWVDSNHARHTGIDIFYATASTALNVRTVQTYQAPLVSLLTGRLVKLQITCNNGVKGCALFGITPRPAEAKIVH